MLDRRSLFLLLAATPLAGRAYAQGGPVVAPIRLQDERIIIDVALNRDGPHPFAIDTGAVVSGVEESIAKRLKLPVIRKVRLAGSAFDLFRVDELVLGGAVRQQNSVLFGLKSNLRGANGLIDAGMVTSFDSTIDLERLQWRVYPAGSADRTGYEKLKSTIKVDPGAEGSKRIGVTVDLDGAPVNLVVDTGMPRSITLERDIGRRLGYWDDSKPYAPVQTVNIAGPTARPSRMVRGTALKLGSQRFDRPVITLRDVAPMQPGYDGVIGLPLLERMNLSVDVTGGALWVRPNDNPQRRERISRTGLWLDEARGGAVVAVVGTGSPAAAAGLKVGDRIPAAKFSDILKLLANDQAPIALPVEGRGTVTIQPADYL